MEILTVLVLIAGALIVAGFWAGYVPQGHQAVRSRLGKRLKEDTIFDEGWHWIAPIVESLKHFKVETIAASLDDFEVPTGTNVNARVSVACEWSIDPANIYDFSSGPDVVRALEGTLKEVTTIYFRYLTAESDMYNAAMISTYSDVLFQAVRRRVAGERAMMRGQHWSALSVQGQPGAFSRLGIVVTGLNVHQVDFPNLVRDAQVRNVAGSIDAKTVQVTGSASAAAVTEIARAGATPDIALLQNERILAPHIRRTEVPDQQNILIQNPTSAGAPFVGGYITSSVKHAGSREQTVAADSKK